MIQHRLIACTWHNNTKHMITNIIACKLKLDIVFRVRCWSPDYYFVGPIRKQRIDSQLCKPGPTRCACLALGMRLGCYGKNKHFVSIICKLPNSTCICNITWTATIHRCRRVTCYDVPIFRFRSPGDSSQPITSYAVDSPTIMRRVAIRLKRRPIWKCYATGVKLFGVRRSPVANKPAMNQSQGALVDVGRNCLSFLS